VQACNTATAMRKQFGQRTTPCETLITECQKTYYENIWRSQ